MRILFVNQILAHYRADVLKLLDDDLRFQCVFLGGSDTSGVATVPKDLLRDVRPVQNVRLGRLKWQVGALKQFIAFRPKVVVFEGDASILSTWLLALVSRICGTTVIYWTIGWRRVDPPGIRGVRRLFYRLADHMLIYGERGKEYGIMNGYPAGRMTVVGNSISEQISVREDPRDLGPRLEILESQGYPIVLAVARVTAIKRFDLLIEAAEIATRKGRGFATVIVGQGPESEPLIAMAKKKSVSLHMLGPVHSAHSLARIYRLASVSVLPKAAGLTTIQSMTHGIPVITDDDHARQVPEADAIVEGVTGDRYRAGSAEDLERVIHEWIVRGRSTRRLDAESCKREVRSRWTPTAHYRRIARVLQHSGDPSIGITKSDHTGWHEGDARADGTSINREFNE